MYLLHFATPINRGANTYGEFSSMNDPNDTLNCARSCMKIEWNFLFAPTQKLRPADK